MMDKLEKTIKGLQCCNTWSCAGLYEGYQPDYDACIECPFRCDPIDPEECHKKLLDSALSLLKVQELPDVKPEKLEEKTTKWLDQMTAEERLEEIAAILDDWDGYRTAKGLGELINEVWAYALYPVKAQEPRPITKDDFANADAWGTIPAWIEYNPKIDGAEPGWQIVDVDILSSSFTKAWNSRPTDEQRKATPWTS